MAIDEAGNFVACDKAPLFRDESQARELAKKFGGRVEDESRIFGDDCDDE